jgi:hypothetical protein
VDRIRPVANEFLRKFTIEAYYGKGLHLPQMTSHVNGSILPEVRQDFEDSAEWREFEDELLAVADAAGAEQKPKVIRGPTVREKLDDPSTYPTMTLDEVRRATSGVSRSTVYRWADEGKLKRADLKKRRGARGRALFLTTSVKAMLESSSE